MSTLQAPDVAVKAGYSELAWSDDFTTTDTIDLTETGVAGKNWYTDLPSWATGQTATPGLSVSNSVLTISPRDTNWNWSICTISPKTGNGRSFGRGYFEARVYVDTTITGSDGSPAFWGLDALDITTKGQARVSNGVAHWGELDFLETIGGSSPSVITTIHDWHNTLASNTKDDKSNQFAANTAKDISGWHTYGCLWETGHVAWFMDGTLLTEMYFDANKTPAPNPSTNLPVGTFSVFDGTDMKLAIILGTGKGFPMQIDWVRVWQPSTRTTDAFPSVDGKNALAPAVRQQLTATFPTLAKQAGTVARVTSPRGGMAFIGDSITAYNSGGWHVWHRLLCQLTGQKIRWAGQFATAGWKLADIQRDHLPSVLAMNPAPGSCVIAGGTNDTGASDFDLATAALTHRNIVQSLLDAGITPVMWLIPPRGDSTTANANVAKWNAYIAEYARRNNFPIIDAHTPLTDPTTGGYKANYGQSDNVHPSNQGHWAIASYMANQPSFIARFADGSPLLAVDASDAANLVTGSDAMMQTAWPVGWGSGITSSTVADPSIAGKWARYDLASGAGGGVQKSWSVTAGHTISMSLRTRINTLGQLGLGVVVDFFDASNKNVGTIYEGGTDYSPVQEDHLFCLNAVVPATATTVRWTIQWSGTSTSATWTQIAQATIRDLTALGLA